MGKIRVTELGDEKSEKKQKQKADTRRDAKKAKKQKPGDEEQVITADGAAPVEEKKQTNKNTKTEEVTKQKHSKRYFAVAALVEKNKLYPVADAVTLVKKTSLTSFDGTVELHINLNKANLNGKSDFRGTVTLPHGTGKKIRVVVADEALIKEIESGKINFDILVAHPSMMAKLAKVARVLGPKGLMPNPKTGTVAEDTDKRVKELSAGQINFKTEPDQPVLHLSIGKVSFTDAQIKENIDAAFEAIGKNKITKATMTATMSPGIKLIIA